MKTFTWSFIIHAGLAKRNRKYRNEEPPGLIGGVRSSWRHNKMIQEGRFIGKTCRNKEKLERMLEREIEEEEEDINLKKNFYVYIENDYDIHRQYSSQNLLICFAFLLLWPCSTAAKDNKVFFSHADIHDLYIHTVHTCI